MAWFKNNLIPRDPPLNVPDQFAPMYRASAFWEEVADAQGTLLNAVSGSGVGTHPAPPSPPIFYAKAFLCIQCGTTWNGKNECPNCVVVVQSDVAKSPSEDDLRAKVIPPFKGEQRCEAIHGSLALPDGAPRPPYFEDSEAHTEKGLAIIRQWLARNMCSWPCCRFSRQPFDLDYTTENAVGGDGELMVGRFYCKECSK